MVRRCKVCTLANLYCNSKNSLYVQTRYSAIRCVTVFFLILINVIKLYETILERHRDLENLHVSYSE